MSKKLNASAVSSAVKKNYQVKQFHLEDNQGEIWDVDVDVKMNPVYVFDMVSDFVHLVAKAADEKFEDFDFEKYWSVLYFVEVLKYYTSVDIKEKDTASKTLLSYVKLVNDLDALGLLDKISECFEENARQNTAEQFASQTIKMSELIDNETDKVIAEMGNEESQPQDDLNEFSQEAES